MTLSDPMSRSGARWCEKHERWECNANKANHHASAIRGMAKCKNCAGRSLDIAKVIGEANIATWSSVAAGEMEPIDAGSAVVSQLRVAVMKADLYGQLHRLQLEVEGLGGLVGATFAAGRDGARVETGEQIRALSNLEMLWRDRVVKYAKTAHDMGIAERVIELHQGQAQLVVSAFMAGLGALPGLLPVDRDAALRAFLTGLGRGPEVLELEAGQVTE
jgi:hypothetical protein